MITKTWVESQTGQMVRVTFTLPSRLWVESIHLVGDLNDWDEESHPFRRNRDGSWNITVDLEPGRSYRFRYLVDGRRWTTDSQADGYALGPTDNCCFVVIAETTIGALINSGVPDSKAKYRT